MMLTWIAVGLMTLSLVGLFLTGVRQRQLFLLVLRHLGETQHAAINIAAQLPPGESRDAAVATLHALMRRQRVEIDALKYNRETVKTPKTSAT